MVLDFIASLPEICCVRFVRPGSNQLLDPLELFISIFIKVNSRKHYISHRYMNPVFFVKPSSFGTSLIFDNQLLKSYLILNFHLYERKLMYSTTLLFSKNMSKYFHVYLVLHLQYSTKVPNAV